MVSAVDGDYRFNKAQGALEWQLPVIDSGSKTGSLEFSCGGDDAGQFFPVNVSFNTSTSLCDIEISEITLVDGGALKFDSTISVVTEEYSIV